MTWKCLSIRGLRETLERRINLTTKDKAAGQECSTIGLQNKFIPCLLSTHVFDDGSGDWGGKCKNGPCNEKKQQNRDQGEKWKQNFNIQQFTLFGALGWSSVMVLGWYICQPICRRLYAKPDIDRFKNQANISRCHVDYISLIELVSPFASAQPLSILPKKKVNHVPTKPIERPLLSDPFVAVSVDETDGMKDSEPGVKDSEPATPFGPLTGEQAVNEAAGDLEKTHKKVLSELEHRIGMACMQLGKHKEAMTHFHKAAELDYAPAAFNIGLCYETGVGTVQDLKLAAKYYELASKWGHATAMYNLGVFHVRGWGGMQIDSNRARQLFSAAAELGQINAKEALAMVPPDKEQSPVESETVHNKSVAENRQDNMKYKSTKKQESVRTPRRIIDSTQEFMQLLGIKSSETSEEGFMINNSIIHNKDMTSLPLVC